MGRAEHRSQAPGAPCGRFARIPRPRVAIALLGLALLAAPAQGQTPCPLPTNEELEVLDLINQQRAANNLAPVELDGRLMESAVRHSDDMRDGCFLSHTGSDGSSKNQRMLDAGYPNPGQEAVGAGQVSPSQIVSAWMASTPHRGILLNATARHVGIGHAIGPDLCVLDPYGVAVQPQFWTADFGKDAGPATPPGSCGGGSPECDDGIDNDGDGFMDAADPGCSGPSDPTETDPALVCDDGADNDSDSLIDAADPGCAGPTDSTETNATVACDDGVDNNNNALVDTADPGCSDPADASEGVALLASESRCAAEQMKRGAEFGNAAFRCWRSYVKNPAKDPAQDWLNACLAKHESKLASSHDKAIQKALRRGQSCRLEDPVPDFLDAAFLQPMQGIRDDILGGWMPGQAGPHENKLRAAILAAAAKLCAKRLQADSGHAGKPKLERLEARRKKAREQFEAQVAKALQKAAKKGVPDPGMDPQMIGDKVEQMADAFAEKVRAVP